MFFPLISESLVSISSSRLRTGLAMLGIIIGVGSVVLMLAIGTGSRKAIEENIAKLGSNLLIVTPGAMETRGIRSTEYSQLTMADEQAISQLASVNLSAPATRPRALQVAARSQNWNTQVTGSTANLFAIRAWELADGENFTNEDVRLGKRVAILGQTVVDKLYNGESAVGRTIRIGALPFQVIGVLSVKGQDMSGRDQDDAVYVPMTTAQRKLFGGFDMNNVPVIYAQAISKEHIDDASDEISELLRQRHRVRAAEEDRFTVRSLTAITQTMTGVASSLSILLGAIASISLVVGGIGIMNIMLVTVTERTREIGIRKAIGATHHHILTQFLLEAVMIAGIGSIAGLLVGLGLAYGVQHWMQVPVYITVWSVGLSLLVAGLVGVLSGLYPALRAASLQPIEALRQVGG